MIDFRAARVVTNGKANSVRFVVESVCRINGTEYVQCASCKGERTFSDTFLFVKNNYDFVPVFGSDGSLTSFRVLAHHRDDFVRTDGTPLETWGEPTVTLKEVDGAMQLRDGKDMLEAAQEQREIVARTILADGAEMIYPVRTLNMRGSEYQVDTGPVVAPGLTLAYIAFNRPDSCEIIRLARTNILENRRSSFWPLVRRVPRLERLFAVDHYSQVQRLDCRNEIYAIN